MNYDSLNWDDAWAEIVRPFHEAHDEFNADSGDMPGREFSKLETKLTRAEAKYDKFCLVSAECKHYAERLIVNLADKNPTYRFAAHTNPFCYPPNSGWRVLVRSATGKAITSQAFQSLERAAKAILQNTEKKYPGEGKKAHEAAVKVYEAAENARLEKQGMRVKKVDGGIQTTYVGKGSGCMLLMVFITSVLGVTLAVVL